MTVCAATYGSWTVRKGQAQEGSFAAVLAMQHHEVFAEHVCIANPKHFKGFLLISLGARAA